MNIDTINQRVIKAISFLLEQEIVDKKGSIAEILQCSPQTITEILGGRQGMKVDLLQKFFDKFNISYEYIFEGVGNILKATSPNAQEYAQKYAQASPDFSLGTGNSKSIHSEKVENNTPFFLPDGGKTTGTNIIELPVPVGDDSDVVHVPVVDISVAAGTGFYNPDYLSEIDSIRFPKSMIKGNHIYLCVRIKGESMVPTLQDGGYLVIRLLDRGEWRDMNDGHVYVVASTDGRAFVKRMKNRLQEYGFIVCRSDNPDPMGYPSFNLMEQEINTIWHAEWYISAKMPNIHATYYNKVSELEDAIEELREGYKGFSSLSEEVKRMRSEIKALSQPS